MLQQESPNSFRCNPFPLPEESTKAIGQCRRSAALEAFFFFPAAHSCCKFLSLKVVCLRPTASSATLWGTSSSARCWRGLASAAICPNCTLSSRCQGHTWERCTTTAHWSAQVRPRLVSWKKAERCMFRASQQRIVFCLRISSILLSYCDACGVLIRCVCVLLRFVVNAEAEKIRIVAAAHLQRSRWSTENVPLSPESETRYGLKAAEIRNRGCVLTAPLYRLLLERQAVQIFMKMLSSCLFFVKFLYVSAR